MGISKRGNQHLRSLLVHGARAVVRTAPNKTDLNNQWVNQLRERRGFNRATVAVANKNARISRASNGRTVPRCLLKARPEFARRRRNETHRSDRRAKSLTFIETLEVYQL